MSHPRFAGALSCASATSRARVLVPLALLATATLIALPPLATPASAQAAGTPAGTGRVTGTVTDSASGRPLSAVQVSVAGTRLGALTDEAGRYAINAVPTGTHTLEARRLGYRMFTRTGVVVTTGGTAAADLRLSIAALNLQAVVTTGVVDPTSGTRVPFTVGRVDAENAPVPAANAVETIQGKIAGVTVVASGQPGGETNVLLRSPTSISKSNSPLVVVDGVILSQSFDASSSDLQGLDIESIEVVKGAAAASLYGSRASSGVIQIRTRRGAGIAEGATRVTARSEVGTNSLGNTIDWAKYHYYSQNDQRQYVDAKGAVLFPNSPDSARAARVPEPAHTRFQDNPYPGTTYDQVDRFFNPGQFYKNSINIAQNGGRTNWFFSFVNTREDGVLLNSGAYEQNDVRLNLDHRPLSNLLLSFSGYHSRSDRQNVYGDAFFDLINQAPDINLLLPDPDGTKYAYQLDPEGREENPLYVLSTEESTRPRARTQGSMEARYSPLSWLSVDGNVSYDRSDRRVNFFLDQGFKTEGFALGGPGEISQTNGTTDALNAAVSANLLGKVGPLTLRSTLRALMERESNLVTTVNGTHFAAPGVRSLRNATQRFFPTATDEEIRSNGYFVTAAADYKGRYVLDGLVRRDGSSLFGPEERYNNYYRVSGAYRMSQESWWPFESVSDFKLRASRGTAGGRPSFSDQYETFGFTEGGGLVKRTLGNRFLKPELATETELGLDAIFRDRYSLQLSYARNRVEDQLLQVPLASVYGYPRQWRNAGTVEGNTIEATIEAQLVRKPTFTWRMGVVADRSRNKITEFDLPCFSTAEIAYRCAGETLGAMYGFRFIQGTNELPASAQARAAEFQRNDDGILVWVGPNNTFKDGETGKLWGTSTTIGTTNYGWGQPITLRDGSGSAALTRIGDGNPDFHFGVSNNVSWRSLSLFALVDAQIGGQVYNATNQRMYQYGRSADVDQAGKPQELKKPIDYYVALYAAADPTSYFVEDAGFVKLREVALRYKLGAQLLGPLARFGAEGASLAVIGRNLLTITDYKGYDPEVGNGIVRRDAFQYPRYRTITGSVEINF
jgi:TonB-linked SusC/RagA family outer membrane protein